MMSEPKSKFFTDDESLWSHEILCALHQVRNDDEIREVVFQLRIELRLRLGNNVDLFFDQTVVSKDVARRVFISGIRFE